MVNQRVPESTLNSEPAGSPASAMYDTTINHDLQRYPFCIVWTTIPCLSWFFPFIGHMGIATSVGIIRDFAGPYHVGTDNMAFGRPTKFIQFDPMNAAGGVEGWDKAICEASEIYKERMHNLFCDNCHSHVAMSLNKMKFKSMRWNMVKLAFLMFVYGKYVGCFGFMKTWLPFLIIVNIIFVLIFAV